MKVSVKMAKNCLGQDVVKGVHQPQRNYEKGVSYEVDESLASCFEAMGALEGKAAAKDEAPKKGKKSKGGAPENKSAE